MSEITDILQSEGEKILANIADVELDPTLLEQLYSTSPLKMTKAQRAVVVESLRRRRAELKVKKAARAAKRKTPSQPAETITLEDLDLKI